MISELSPERRISLREKAGRYLRRLRRGRLGFESKLIKVRTYIENKKFQFKKAFLTTMFGWQSRRAEKGGKKRKLEIEKLQQKAEEYLKSVPNLLKKAEDRQRRLLGFAEDSGEHIVDGSRSLGRVAGKIVWEAGHAIWIAGFTGGVAIRRGIESIVERISKRGEK